MASLITSFPEYNVLRRLPAVWGNMISRAVTVADLLVIGLAVAWCSGLVSTHRVEETTKATRELNVEGTPTD